MKSSATLTCFTAGLVLCASLAFGQAEPRKPTYQNVVYKSDGNTYVQKSLPLYLKFSTTPGGEDHELTSKASAKYANPMYLDTEGVNYIRSKWAVDPATGKTAVPQQEVLFELYSDGLAPRTSVSFTGAPRYASGGTVYYGKGLTVTLTPRDAVSGVKETQYALGGGYQKYNSPFASNSEGANSLYWFSADNVGNAENTNSRNYTVDLTAPKTSHSIVGIVHNGNIIAPSTRFELSKSDNLSGVAVTYYYYDSRGQRVYSSPAGVSALNDGDHTLYYYSRDNVKNEENRGSFNFYLDKIPPVVTSTVVGDQYQGNYLFISNRTKIQLTATDNKAGVENIYYRIDGGERNTYGNQFSMPDVRGTHSVKYDATDNVKNLAPNKYLNVYMDNKTPTTGIDYKQPQFFNRDTLFINAKTPIRLFARDSESGVAKTEYAIDGGAFKPYSEFTIPPEGFHTITFKSTDRVNNVETVKTSEVYVDNTSPDISHSFSIKPIGNKKKGGLSMSVYPEYTRLYLAANDRSTGTKSITYSVNGGPMTAYSSPYTLDISEVSRFKKKKFYEVKVVAKDMLGNTSEKTIEFYVGREDD